ncbi:MAG TPA: hypothetical protein VH595_24415 [Verrucomicrobiae bacterium]|nr:hypothetical protein [Verrucomicrobiae bacterium]
MIKIGLGMDSVIHLRRDGGSTQPQGAVAFLLYRRSRLVKPSQTTFSGLTDPQKSAQPFLYEYFTYFPPEFLDPGRSNQLHIRPCHSTQKQ